MTFAHPHFAEREWLWLAVLAPVVVLLLHRYAAWGRKRQIALFAAPELIAGLMRSHSPVRRALKNLLLVFAIAGMGLALDEGYRAMEKNNRRKIMVLVTDGEDLEKTGIQTARDLAQKGIVVFAVGVGTAAGSPIQFANEQGILESVRDTDGSIVQSRLDEATLTAIAQATKGTYEPLGALGEGLTRV